MSKTVKQLDNLKNKQNNQDDQKSRISEDVAILPLRNTVAFPFTILFASAT